MIGAEKMSWRGPASSRYPGDSGAPGHTLLVAHSVRFCTTISRHFGGWPLKVSCIIAPIHPPERSMAASISVLHVGSAAPALASDTDFGRCIWSHCDTLDQAQAAIAEAAPEAILFSCDSDAQAQALPHWSCWTQAVPSACKARTSATKPATAAPNCKPQATSNWTASAANAAIAAAATAKPTCTTAKAETSAAASRAQATLR